jgi:hypothetical protein
MLEDRERGADGEREAAEEDVEVCLEEPWLNEPARVDGNTLPRLGGVAGAEPLLASRPPALTWYG